MGMPEGQTIYGVCLLRGVGVASNAVDATGFLRKAADHGYAFAQYVLASNYEVGEGVAKDASEAVKWCRKAAEQGYAPGQFHLALRYSEGVGVAKDATESLKWLRKAAEQGYAPAQLNLGSSYLIGDGVDKDEGEAKKWFTAAADRGNDRAQYNLGWCYQHGAGVTKDEPEAAKWFRKAADQGLAEAQYALGRCLSTGQGVAADVQEAVKWYRKAADQGNATAHEALGGAYDRGCGVIQDDLRACSHYLIAGALGTAEARSQSAVERLRTDRLTRAEYADAQRLAAEWMERHRDKSVAVQTSEDEPQPLGTHPRQTSSGSGFVISEDGYFLTCAHVVEDGSVYKVLLGGSTYSAVLVQRDPLNDLALLKLSGKGFSPVPLRADLPNMGARVFTIGFPHPSIQGPAAKFTDGVISSMTGIQDDVRTLQITVPVQGGNSGGPLFDSNGNVLGVVVSKLNAISVFSYTGDMPQNVNFAVKIGYAMPLVQNVLGLSGRLKSMRASQSDPGLLADLEKGCGLVLVYK